MWLDVVRKPVTFYFRSPKDAQPKLNFELLGSWQGQQLVLEDRGSMTMSLAPDGGAKGYLKGVNTRKESTTGTLHYATGSEFSPACSTKKTATVSSFHKLAQIIAAGWASLSLQYFSLLRPLSPDVPPEKQLLPLAPGLPCTRNR